MPPWQSSDGGTLDLYTTDSECPAVCVLFCAFRQHKSCIIYVFVTGNFQPQSIVKSLVPSLNTLVLFEVSPVSFHQVRITSAAFLHHCCTKEAAVIPDCCVCPGVRDFDAGQVSSVSERLVSRAIFGASSSSHRGPHPTEPTLTQRCECGQRRVQFLFNCLFVNSLKYGEIQLVSC